MTGSVSVFSKKYQNILGKEIATRRSEFQQFITWAKLESIDTPNALLCLLSTLDESNAAQLSVIDALIEGAREPSTARFCSKVICWAFAKRIRGKGFQIRRAKEDAGQACVVGLLQATRLKKNNSRAPVEENSIRRLYKGIDSGLKNMKKQERTAFVAYGAALQRGAMLQGAEASGPRERAERRIRFDEREREIALKNLRLWSGESVDQEKFYEAWDAVVLKGEPIKSFLERSANSDSVSCPRAWNRVSAAKRRAQERLRDSIERSAAAQEFMRSLDLKKMLSEAANDSVSTEWPKYRGKAAFAEYRLWKQEDFQRLKSDG